MIDRRAMLRVIVEGMEIGLQDRGWTSVEDAKALLSEDELAFAKEHGLLQVGVRILKEAHHLRKLDVVNSVDASRKGGWVARWAR